MIYTITFNPALDYIVSVKDFKPGMTNRTDSELLLPGGKGINVSIVLKNLGFDSTALGFIAGFSGEEIRRRVEETGCRTEFIVLPEGCSRINVKLKNMEGTEINGRGPAIDEKSLQALFMRLDTLQEGDVLVLAGSIPASLPGTIYRDICERLSGRGILIAVDAAGGLLQNVLPLRPFLIKPNHHELGEIFGVKIKTAEEVIPYAGKLKEMGAENVLVSMAGDGALLLDGNGDVHIMDAPVGQVVNSVGAGDAMLAGFLAGDPEKNGYDYALKLGIASGSARAFSEFLPKSEQIMAIFNKL